MAIVPGHIPLRDKTNNMQGRQVWNVANGGIFSEPGPSLVPQFTDVYSYNVHNDFPDPLFNLGTAGAYDIIRSSGFGDLVTYVRDNKLYINQKLNTSEYIEWRIAVKTYTWYEFSWGWQNIKGSGHLLQVGTLNDGGAYWSFPVSTLSTSRTKIRFKTGSNTTLVIRIVLLGTETETAFYEPVLYKIPMAMVQAVGNLKNWVINPEFKITDTAIVADNWVVNGSDPAIKHQNNQQFIGKTGANNGTYVGIRTDSATEPTFATKSLYYFHVRLMVIAPTSGSANVRITVHTTGGDYTHDFTVSGSGQVRILDGKPITNVAGFTKMGMSIQTNTFGAKLLILGSMLSELPSGFFTGDYATCSWDGTANASASQYTGASVLESSAPPFEDVDQGTFIFKFRLINTTKNYDYEPYLMRYNSFLVQLTDSERILIGELNVGLTAFLSSSFTFFSLRYGASSDGWNTLGITYGKGSYKVYLNGVALTPATGSEDYNLFWEYDNVSSPNPSPELELGLEDSTYDKLIIYGIADFLWIPQKINESDLGLLTTEPDGQRYPDIIGFLEERGYI